MLGSLEYFRWNPIVWFVSVMLPLYLEIPSGPFVLRQSRYGGNFKLAFASSALND